VEAVGFAARRTREPIAILVPLLLQAAQALPFATKRVAVPSTRIEQGVPLYALDKHTRLGRTAIKQFAAENGPLRHFLELHVEARHRRDAALMAAYYVDAMPTACRLDWPLADELEALGRETDLLRAGVPVAAQQDLCELLSANLRHLNEIRAAVLSASMVGEAHHG